MKTMIKFLGLSALVFALSLSATSCAVVAKVSNAADNYIPGLKPVTQTAKVGKTAEDAYDSYEKKKEKEAAAEAKKNGKVEAEAETTVANATPPDEVEQWGQTEAFLKKSPESKYKDNVDEIRKAKFFRGQEATLSISDDSNGRRQIEIDRIKQAVVVQFTFEHLQGAQNRAQDILQKVQSNPNGHGYEDSTIKNAGHEAKWWKRRYEEQVRELAFVNEALQRNGGKLEMIVFPNDPAITKRVQTMSLGIELAAALPAAAQSETKTEVASTTIQSPK